MIAIDFDGVLHEYKGWDSGKLGNPIPGALEFVTEILRRGADAAVFTTRDEEQVGQWLKQHGFPPLMITQKKLGMFHVFLDDRAFRFDGRFDDVKKLVSELQDFKPYWRV